MSEQIESIARLKNQFSKLPGVGGKTAMRFAHFIVEQESSFAEQFAEAILEVKQKVQLCPRCGYFLEKGQKCQFCDNASRKKDIICVVAFPKDVIALEKTKSYNGEYHVLNGVISPLQKKGPNDLRIKELLERVKTNNIKEVIMATNPDIEGEATAIYISNILKPLGIKVSRIAQGIQMGSDIEFADVATLQHALENRNEI